MEDIRGKALVITGGFLDGNTAKTAHGLLRGSERFEILAVIDSRFAGQDAGDVMQGKPLGIRVYASVLEYLQNPENILPDFCIVGVATHGGYLPPELKAELLQAARKGIHLVSGLHYMLNDDPDFQQAAEESGIRIFDVRRVRPRSELRFWTGEIEQVNIPKIAVLGTDCALGKRTTCRFLLQACLAEGIPTEMIYTGQTGWMQGHKHGFIFDSTINDFISGEIERVILDCARESKPELILLEGQSALRNPSGPCGSEFLLSGQIPYVVLQHAPGRKYYDGTEIPIFSIESEIELIRLYGAETIALTLNEEALTEQEVPDYQQMMNKKLGIPVLRPLQGELNQLIPKIRSLLGEEGFQFK